MRLRHVGNADYVLGMRGVKSNASVFHEKRNAGYSLEPVVASE